jgi:outer membrane protein TolC
LQTRADVLSALAEYDAAQSALQLEIAKQYPDIHLQPGYQFDQGDNKWSLGLVVELPVLSHNQGPIKEAQAKREEAATHFIEVQTKVMSELDAGVELLSLTQKNLEDLRGLAQTQAEREKALLAQKEAGQVEPIDLLRAQFESASGTLILLDGQLKLQQAIGTLENAVQQPFEFNSTLLDSPRAHVR